MITFYYNNNEDNFQTINGSVPHSGQGVPKNTRTGKNIYILYIIIKKKLYIIVKKFYLFTLKKN